MIVGINPSISATYVETNINNSCERTASNKTDYNWKFKINKVAEPSNGEEAIMA
ncbi:hypothetical protein [Clostridium butyricum]|uniref:hypothetical protein n=1 Tax=Clostridium butyricum TaxID=1492 RepID=UPI0015E41B05|nr:hypothetical protein [Clostridium butyricum]